MVQEQCTSQRLIYSNQTRTQEVAVINLGNQAKFRSREKGRVRTKVQQLTVPYSSNATNSSNPEKSRSCTEELPNPKAN